LLVFAFSFDVADGTGVVAGRLGRTYLDAPGLSCMARDKTLERTNPLQTTLILKDGGVHSRMIPSLVSTGVGARALSLTAH
jgi:hypothetical protein